VGQVHLGDESVPVRAWFPEVSWFGGDHMCLSVGIQNLGRAHGDHHYNGKLKTHQQKLYISGAYFNHPGDKWLFA
jgi:hypothetical protein